MAKTPLDYTEVQEYLKNLNPATLMTMLEQISDASLLRVLADRRSAAGAFGRAGVLVADKNEDYNAFIPRDAYFPMGLVSYAQMLHTKSLRVVSMAMHEVKQRNPKFESAVDSVRDLLNYASFCEWYLVRLHQMPDKEAA